MTHDRDRVSPDKREESAVKREKDSGIGEFAQKPQKPTEKPPGEPPPPPPTKEN